MAKTPSRPPEAPAAPPAAPSASPMKMVAIAVTAAVLVLGAGGGALWYFLGERASAGKTDGAAAQAKHPPVFVDLDVFTVNLRGAESDRFLQARIVLEMSSNEAAEALKARMPAVRNEFLLLLSGKSPEQALSRDGKEKIAAELVAAAAGPLAGTPAERGVEKLLFSHFIVQ